MKSLENKAPSGAIGDALLVWVFLFAMCAISWGEATMAARPAAERINVLLSAERGDLGANGHWSVIKNHTQGGARGVLALG
jgi:hypothetical protein